MTVDLFSISEKNERINQITLDIYTINIICETYIIEIRAPYNINDDFIDENIKYPFCFDTDSSRRIISIISKELSKMEKYNDDFLSLNAGDVIISVDLRDRFHHSAAYLEIGSEAAAVAL